MKWVSGIHGSAAKIFGYEVYGDNCPKWVDFLHSWLVKGSDALWAIKYRWCPEHQYHIVRTELKPGYHDECEIILYAMMKLLEQYVEGFKHKYGYGDDENKSAEQIIEEFNKELRESKEHTLRQASEQEECLRIYRWWKNERPANLKKIDELMSQCYGGGLQFEPCVDNPKLLRLVNKEPSPLEVIRRRELHDLEEKVYRDEQDNLKKIIEVRRGMWH